jgi:hypothetical protein
MNEKEERDLLEMMRTQAKMVRSYFDALIEQKFTPADAMRLTMAFISRRIVD